MPASTHPRTDTPRGGELVIKAWPRRPNSPTTPPNWDHDRRPRPLQPRPQPLRSGAASRTEAAGRGVEAEGGGGV